MDRKPFKKVAIVGVGLIGGSIGLAMKKRGLAQRIVGVTRTPESARAAIKAGAIDQAANFGDAVNDAELIVLASPVLEIIKHLRQLAKNHQLIKGTIIDVGSSKGEICAAAEDIRSKGLRFVGCHPMAGSEKRGVEHAGANLFDGAICLMTTQDERIGRLWLDLGIKRILSITPEEHDAYVSAVSHLTHFVSYVLVHSLENEQARVKNITLQNPNPSLQTLIRLAKSDPEVWADIFVSNQSEVKSKIKNFRSSLDQFEKHLGTKSNIQALLEISKKIADHLLLDKPN